MGRKLRTRPLIRRYARLSLSLIMPDDESPPVFTPKNYKETFEVCNNISIKNVSFFIYKLNTAEANSHLTVCRVRLFCLCFFFY
jgi:hypothetical protein